MEPVTAGKKIIAITGTRNPEKNQVNQLVRFIERIERQSVIITGCARGIDERAIREGNHREHKTIGVIPWGSYNRDVQRACSEIINLEKVPREERARARESVITYHPGIREYPKTQFHRAVFLLHARNYLIVRDANVLVAFPQNRSGGTMQSVRIAIALQIPYSLVD